MRAPPRPSHVGGPRAPREAGTRTDSNRTAVSVAPPTHQPAPRSEHAGEAMHELLRGLYPLCRSLTGDGVRQTLRTLGRRIDLTIHEVASGTRVLDWEVPPEWNVRDAYVADSRGRRVVDFRRSNLHLVGYSVPVQARMSLQELRPRLHSLPDRPDWIPYRTSYYVRDWGFCLEHRRLQALPEGEYEVRIDATLEPGHLTYGECRLRGERSEEVLVHAHVCHPSLCNDNLSGVVIATELARRLADRPRRLSYRFLFLPGTIGAITWLATHQEELAHVRHGLVLSGLGDPGRLTYKRSRRGNAAIDRAAAHVLSTRPERGRVVDFSPLGYDERQYCSPGFDLPVGSLGRSAYGSYPQYHTSADDPGFVRPAALADALEACLEIIDVLEGDATYENLSPCGEPQLGRRGLYGSPPDTARVHAMLWVLNLSDGDHSLLDIAVASELPFRVLRDAARSLEEAGLLRELPVEPSPEPGHDG